MNDNSRLARQPADQVLQVTAGKRDTACGGTKTWPRNVNEYRAAMAADARSRVVVDFDDQIVKPIGTL